MGRQLQVAHLMSLNHHSIASKLDLYWDCYFCFLMSSRMEYIESKGEFVDLPEDLTPPNDPGFCMNCTRAKAAEARAFPQFSQEGFELHGIPYHPYDFVQFKTGNVTCGIGQIILLGQEALDRRDPQIKVRLLGKFSDVTGKPKHILKDEVGYQIVVVARN